MTNTTRLARISPTCRETHGSSAPFGWQNGTPWTAKHADDLKQSMELLEWVAAHALPSGVLAEQVDPYTGQPVSVSPLTWSHAAYVSTVLTYLQRKKHLRA